VRREDLNDTSSVESLASGEDEERADLQRVLREKLQDVMGWDQHGSSFPSSTPSHGDLTSKGPAGCRRDDSRDGGAATDDKGEEPAAEEFEFRLFRSAKPGMKVILEEERPFKPGDGGIIARRPASYYVKPPASAEERRRFETVSLTGDEVLARSSRPYWGLELPWRIVAKLEAANTAKPLPLEGPKVVTKAAGEIGKRKRPGKKRRIARRQKDRAAKQEQEQQEKEKITKEEHLKAKKKRLNHAKKMRARIKAKEKQKKLAPEVAAADELVQGASASEVAIS